MATIIIGMSNVVYADNKAVGKLVCKHAVNQEWAVVDNATGNELFHGLKRDCVKWATEFYKEATKPAEPVACPSCTKAVCECPKLVNLYRHAEKIRAEQARNDIHLAADYAEKVEKLSPSGSAQEEAASVTVAVVNDLSVRDGRAMVARYVETRKRMVSEVCSSLHDSAYVAMLASFDETLAEHYGPLVKHYVRIESDRY